MKYFITILILLSTFISCQKEKETENKDLNLKMDLLAQKWLLNSAVKQYEDSVVDLEVKEFEYFEIITKNTAYLKDIDSITLPFEIRYSEILVNNNPYFTGAFAKVSVSKNQLILETIQKPYSKIFYFTKL